MGETWRKFRRGIGRKSKVRKRWSMKQGRRAQKFISPHWWTSVIWRMPNWRQSTKNTKVELYSGAILWKTIRGLMQYSQNKDHQHHKWQRQKSWIPFPDCRVAQDKQLMQYLLIPRSKWKMLQNYWKFPNRNVKTFGFVCHDTNGPNHGPVWKTQSFLFSAIFMVILWQDCDGKGNLRKSFWNTVRRKFPIGNAYSYTVKKDYSYLCMWMTSNWLEGNKTLIRCGKYSIKKSIWENQHLSLIMFVWGVLKDTVKLSKDIVDSYRAMFESRICARWTEKLPYSVNFRISSWSYDMEGHAKKCVERYCDLASKTTQQLHKVSTPCIDDHHSKEEELKSVGELSKVCSQIVLKCLYLARFGRPDILWSVNKLARSITKWTRACDKRLNRLISYIHHTCEYKQYCHVGNTAKQCRLGLFQDSAFAGDLENSKSTSDGTLCVFGSHTFVPISWMCKKTNFSFTQFNRIGNHLFRCRIEIRRYSRTWFMGSDCLSPWKHNSEPW